MQSEKPLYERLGDVDQKLVEALKLLRDIRTTAPGLAGVQAHIDAARYRLLDYIETIK